MIVRRFPLSQRWRRLPTLVLAVVLSCLTLSAQDVSTPKPAETGSEGAGPLKFDSEVTVTASRRESAREGDAAATTVVTRDELRVRNLPTLDRALELVSGVYVFRSRGTADILSRVMMRGFNGSNRTLTLLDGTPLNDAYAGDVTWTSLPTGEVERIEIVRGAFSALYGGNAMGGVINVLTRPIAHRQLSASAQGGTYGTGQFSGHYGHRVGPMGLSVGYQGLRTDGYAPREIVVSPAAAGSGVPATGAVATQSATGAAAFIIGSAGTNWLNQDAVRVKAEWALGAKASLSTQYLFQRSEYGYDNPQSDLRDASGNVVDSGAVLFQDGAVQRRFTVTPGTFLQGPGDDRSHFVGAALHRAFGSNHLVRANGGWHVQPQSTSRTPAAATATATGGPGSISARDSRTSFANVQDTWTIGAHTVSAGLDLRNEQSDNEEFALTDWTSSDSKGAQTFASFGRTRAVAAYVQDEARLGDRVSLSAGLRLDRWRTSQGAVNIFNAAVPATTYEPRSASSFSGKGSIAYRPGGGWTVRGSVGTAFRTPSVFELYRTFRLSTGTLFAANPDLQPEHLLAGEVGVVRTWKEGRTLDVAYYRNSIDDLIYRKTDLTVDPAGRYRILVNAGQGSTDGLEVSLSQRLTRSTLVRATYTFTDAVISRNPAIPETEGKRVPNIPEHMASASAFYAKGRVNASLNGRYVSETFGLDTNLDTTKGVPGSYSESFVVGASVAYRAVRQVEFFASADNLFNRQYYVFYLNPGRSVSAGVRIALDRR